MPRILESTFLEGPAGHLEALHEGPDDGVEMTRAVVICHPHPLHGGTMHNKVVFRLAKAARKAGAAVLRFNFRGVGASAGSHDAGRGEQDDCRAAISYMRERYDSLPLLVSGFSFGSRVALQVACADPAIDRVVAVGTAVDHGDWEFLSECLRPKHLIHGTNDEHGSRQNLERVYAGIAEPKQLTWVETCDHFFSDSLNELEATALQALS